MAQADGLLMQTDDIYSVKLLSTSLVHVAFTANERTALHLNGWLAFTRAGVGNVSPGVPQFSSNPNQTHLNN